MTKKPSDRKHSFQKSAKRGLFEDMLEAYREGYEHLKPSLSAKEEAWIAVQQHIQSAEQGVENESTRGVDPVASELSSADAQKSFPKRIFTLYKLPFNSVAKYAAMFLVALLGSWAIYNTFDQGSAIHLLTESTDHITEVNLEDGSTIHLRPNSQLYRIPSSGDDQHYKIEGEAYFHVAKQHKGYFIVNTDEGQIKVLGTEFNIKSYTNQTHIYLEEGSVSLMSLPTANSVSSTLDETQEPIIMKPQTSATIQEGSIRVEENETSTAYTDWMESALYVTGIPFESLLNELSQHYDIQLTITQPPVENFANGSLILGDVDQTLANFSLLFNGKFIKKSNRKYEFTGFD